MSKVETSWVWDVVFSMLIWLFRKLHDHPVYVIVSLVAPILAVTFGGMKVQQTHVQNQAIDLVRHIQASGGVAIQLDRDERIVQVLGDRELLGGVQNIVLEGAPIESIVRLDSSATSGRRSYRELFNNCSHRLGKTTHTEVRVHVSSFSASGSSWMIVYRVETPTAKDDRQGANN